MSKDADKFAIDDSFEERLLMIEKEEMQSYIRVLYQNNEMGQQEALSSENDTADEPQIENQNNEMNGLDEKRGEKPL